MEATIIELQDQVNQLTKRLAQIETETKTKAKELSQVNAEPSIAHLILTTPELHDKLVLAVTTNDCELLTQLLNMPEVFESFDFSRIKNIKVSYDMMKILISNKRFTQHYSLHTEYFKMADTMYSVYCLNENDTAHINFAKLIVEQDRDDIMKKMAISSTFYDVLMLLYVLCNTPTKTSKCYKTICEMLLNCTFDNMINKTNITVYLPTFVKLVYYAFDSFFDEEYIKWSHQDSCSTTLYERLFMYRKLFSQSDYVKFVEHFETSHGININTRCRVVDFVRLKLDNLEAIKIFYVTANQSKISALTIDEMISLVHDGYNISEILAKLIRPPEGKPFEPKIHEQLFSPLNVESNNILTTLHGHTVLYAMQHTCEMCKLKWKPETCWLYKVFTGNQLNTIKWFYINSEHTYPWTNPRMMYVMGPRSLELTSYETSQYPFMNATIKHNYDTVTVYNLFNHLQRNNTMDPYFPICFDDFTHVFFITLNVQQVWHGTHPDVLMELYGKAVEQMVEYSKTKPYDFAHVMAFVRDFVSTRKKMTRGFMVALLHIAKTLNMEDVEKQLKTYKISGWIIASSQSIYTAPTTDDVTCTTTSTPLAATVPVTTSTPLAVTSMAPTSTPLPSAPYIQVNIADLPSIPTHKPTMIVAKRELVMA